MFGNFNCWKFLLSSIVFEFGIILGILNTEKHYFTFVRKDLHISSK